MEKWRNEVADNAGDLYFAHAKRAAVLVAGLENEKKIQSVHSEQNRYFNVSVPAFLMYYYRSETG